MNKYPLKTIRYWIGTQAALAIAKHNEDREMYIHNRNRQSGFTLVEIAIVLVIIGLLLGGILKGQELINSARVRNLADLSSASQAAYFGFIDRYRQIPGDWQAGTTTTFATSAIGQTINSGGNADGRIDDGSWAEAGGVWEQLSKAGFITGNYQGGATDAITYRATAPLNPFSGAILLSYLDDYLVASGTATARLIFVFGEFVPVKLMRELDVKLDDGVPTTGVLRAGTSATTSYGAINQSTVTCTSGIGTAATWDVAADAVSCIGNYLY